MEKPADTSDSLILRVHARHQALDTVREAVIDPVSGSMHILQKNERTVDYHTWLKETSEQIVPAERRMQAQKRMSLEAVIEAISQRRTLNCIFQQRQKDCHIGLVLWEYFWLDDTHKEIVLFQKDLNDFCTKQKSIAGRELFFVQAQAWHDCHVRSEASVVMFDVDRFKMYNDQYGVPAGDLLLQKISECLEAGLMNQNLIAGRMYNDRFAFVFPGNEKETEEAVQELMAKIHNTCGSDTVSMHFGMCRMNATKCDLYSICNHALYAQQSIKRNASVFTAWYNESMHQQLLLEQGLEKDIAQALLNHEFVAYLQPQYDQNTNRMIGAEVLARWNHPSRGCVMPGLFVPLMEKNGTISALDIQMFEQACMILEKWKDRYHLTLSVNLSRGDLYDPQLVQHLLLLAKVHHVDHSRIHLEITESAYTENPDQGIAMVKKLRRHGFAVEMDDFGSGYSSLNTLKNMPVDLIKLDLGFLKNDENEQSGIILNSVVQMAHWLNLPVIAEGVETRAQAEYLKTIGCRYIQGYYFSRPLSQADFETLMTKTDTLSEHSFNNIVAEFYDFKMFWNPSSEVSLLFNMVAGPAGIFTFDGKRLIAQRVNDAFYHISGLTGNELLTEHQNLLMLHSTKTRDALELALNTAWDSEQNEPESVESAWHVKDRRDLVWGKLSIKCIARTSARCALYIMVEDITRLKHLESENRKLKQN